MTPSLETMQIISCKEGTVTTLCMVAVEMTPLTGTPPSAVATTQYTVAWVTTHMFWIAPVT